MISILKKKKNYKSIKTKLLANINPHKDKAINFRKAQRNQSLKNVKKYLQMKRFSLSNKQQKYLFLELIQDIDKELNLKESFKKDFVKLSVGFFFNKIPSLIKIKLHETTEGIKNLLVKSLKHKSKNFHFRKKYLNLLRRQKKSKLSSSFYQPWKKIEVPFTKKQNWLNLAYNSYTYLRFKDRSDFFRGFLGKLILLTELSSHHDYKSTWFGRHYFFWKNKAVRENNPELFNEIHKIYTTTTLSNQKLQSKIMLLKKQGWWYENLVQKKKLPKSIKKFILDRPNTAFRIYWQQRQREPWKNALLFKRSVYSGFAEDLRKENKFNLLKIKPYLRQKNPRYEKRNQVYYRLTLLLANRRQKFRLQANKIVRIKQITSKILFPFYGNLRYNQINKILKKSRFIKSKRLSSNELKLLHFESRLDVVVYRLNLAPTILWARRLILDGCIFVNPQNLDQSKRKWSSMYGPLKKFSFPLKLRDPKNLYCLSLLENLPHHWGTFKFLDHPQRNISHLLKPGDLIQCSLDNSLNKFKTNSFLWQKPKASHLLIAKKKVFLWQWLSQKYMQKELVNRDEISEKTNASIFLHSPVWTDLHHTDRIKESFLRWAGFQ